MARDKREYGLTGSDRKYIIQVKFGSNHIPAIEALLSNVVEPRENVLGAILFLARPGNFEDIENFIELANNNVSTLLNAAQVKDERT
ncbi:hypothetical protein HV213_32800 (plasmid) [Klebsiella sp. RHBSTW-00484]|uniref:hypothetical protein n=1 Tax=unclassified Klebsiella TaxID=2608929 RepID=UPI0015E577A6|nr:MULTISPECIES: hypothetical protein [unclassified Klebsiella]QLO40562.1 hypothetical protein HV213_32800 [Klebsiella sp. RHBSTW-00484]QLT80098.1 hypothetical protein HV204_32910 [Klebsiella sp. RHBSTW-00464]